MGQLLRSAHGLDVADAQGEDVLCTRHGARSRRTGRPGVIQIVAALLVAYLPLAIYLDRSYTPADPTVMRRPFVHLDRNAWVSYHFIPGAVPDSDEAPTQSALRLYEDGRPLRAPHIPHGDIAAAGLGLYSHWRGNAACIVFSTSDNSDPNANGRTYRAIDPAARDPVDARKRKMGP